MEVTVSSKGQISLPAELRRTLDIRKGDRLALEAQADGSILLRRRKASNAHALVGAWRRSPDQYEDVDEIMTELRGPAGE